MYVKLKSNGYSSSYTAYYGHLGIQQAIHSGSIRTSDPINSALSAAVGTGPTAGRYPSGSGEYDSDNANTSEGWMYFTKKYYVQDGSFTPKCKWRHDWTNSTYGWRIGHYSDNLSNRGPYSNTSCYWTGYSSTTNNYGWVAPYWQNIDEVHLIINDTTFALQVIGTGTDTSKKISTFVLNDLEYNASIDTHAYAGNAQYCPTVSFWATVQGNTLVDNASPTSDQHRFVCYRPQYADKNGTYQNTLDTDTTMSWGYWDTNTNRYATLYPSPRDRVQSMQVANGEITHQLVPTYWQGNMGHEDGDPRKGRLMNCYRTTEGASYQTGDVITDGTTRYRIFANCWKGGGANMSSAVWNQTLAFPEDNVPYSAP